MLRFLAAYHIQLKNLLLLTIHLFDSSSSKKLHHHYGCSEYNPSISLSLCILWFIGGAYVYCSVVEAKEEEEKANFSRF